MNIFVKKKLIVQSEGIWNLRILQVLNKNHDLECE